MKKKTERETQASVDSAMPRKLAGHTRLEPRRLLNADFDLLGGGVLELDNFQDDDAGADRVTISQAGDVYSFVLDDGVWVGDDSPVNLSGAGTNTLQVDTSLGALSSILITNNNNEVPFDIEFGNFDFGGPLSITDSGGADPFFANLNQTAATTMTLSGTLTVDAVDTIDLQNTNNDFSIVDVQAATDVSFNDTNAIQFTALEATNNALVTAGGDVDLAALIVGGNLDVTSTGDITDSGSIDVTGNAEFTANGGTSSISLDQLEVDGTIGVQSTTFATIVNATGVDLAASNVGTDLDVTATTGDIVDSGSITVGGNAAFNSVAGSIDLGSLDVTGPISLDSAGAATIVNVGDIDLALSNVGTNLDVTSTTGSITDSGLVTVGGEADFDAADSLLLDQLDVTGAIGLTVVNDATLVNTTAVDLKTSNVGGNLNVTATTGDITDSGVVTVGGEADFTSTAGAINLDQLAVTGSIGLNAATSATIVNATSVDLKASNVGTNLDVTATTGDITDSGVTTVGGEADFNSVAGAINLDQLDVTGSIGLQSATSATVVNTTAVDLKASTIGTDLDVTATTGNVTDSGVITVGGDADIEATANSIGMDQLNVTGSIGLVAGGSATIVNAQAVDLKASNVGTNLDVTATTGDITDSGVVTVGGEGDFQSVAGAINLDQLDVTGSIGLQAATSATVVNTTAVDLKASTIGTDLDVTATTGNVTDSGVITVGGDADIEATANSIGMDQLNVTGSIGLVAGGSATIVNAQAVDLKASNVGTNLDVTATTGDVTDSGVVTVGGEGDFNSVAGAINLDQLDVTGSIGLQAATSATIVNTTAVDLKASTIGTDLDVTATSGDISDSGTVTVGGEADFDSVAGAINLDQLDVTGSIGLQAATSATLVNTQTVDLKTSTIGTDLDVTATTGDITDSGTVTVGGEADFNSVAGAINLDQLDVAGPIGLNAATSASIVNAQAVDLKASNVGANLNVTATTGDVTDSGLVIVGGNAVFEATAGAIDLDQLNVTGSIGLVSALNATISTAAIDFLASNIGGNLNATATVGNLTQSAAIVVAGTSNLNANGDICLNDPNNDFVGVVDASATVVEIVDINDLATGTITATDDIFLRAGAGGTGALTLGLTVSTSAVDGQVLLQAADGVTQIAGSIISTSELLLGGDAAVEGSGDFVLDGANVVAQLAAGLQDSLLLNNTTSLVVGDLVYDSTCLTNEPICGVSVGGNLTLDVTGSLTQAAAVIVGGTTDLTATAEICLTGGDCTGDGLNDNDFVGVVSATATTVEIVDSNDLATGVIAAVDDVFLRSGDNGAGGLTLTGNISTSAINGQVLLQSDSGVSQTGGVISTAELLLGGDDADEGTGAFDLIQNNNVGILAADISGELDLINVAPIVVDSLTYSSVCGTAEAIANLDVTDKIRLRANGGNSITLNQSVVSQMVFLESSNGVTQAVAGTILADSLMLAGTGTFDLATAANNVDLIAADITGTLNYFDDDSLTVAELDCDGTLICGLNLTNDLNLTTNNGDLFQVVDAGLPTENSAAVIVGGNTVLDTGTGDICLIGGDCNDDGINENLFGGTLTIISTGDVVIAENDDITIDSVTSTGSLWFIGDNITINTAITANQLLLQASDGVFYNNQVLDVVELLVTGQGLFDFGGVGDTANSIDRLAVDIDGDFNLINATDLEIADLTLVSDCGTVAVCGIHVDAGLLNGDLNLQLVDANLTQTAAVVVAGNTTLAAGSGDICLSGASCTVGVTNENDFNTLIIESADDASVVDINDLSVTSATVTSDLHLRAGEQVAGALTLNGNLVSGEQMLLQASDGMTQTAGTISTPELLLGGDDDAEGTGDVVLSNSNTVAQLAAELQGSLTFVNANSLIVGDLTYADDCGITEAICGLNIGGDLDLNVNGDLTQVGAVIVGGGSDLTATGLICLTGGDCTGDGLNDNDFGGLVNATGTTVELVDANDLQVGIVAAVDDVFLRAGDNGTGAITLNGSVSTTAAAGQVLLQADSGVNQIAGNITTNDLLLGGDLADEGSGNFVLDAGNQVVNLAAELQNDLVFTNAISLVIGDLNYASICGTTEAICGLNVGQNLSLSVTGSLSQVAAVIVGGTTDLEASAEICLTGGDCTGDGLNDNDFVGLVNASGTTVELVDANGLNVGVIAAVDDVFLRAGDNGVGALTLNGNISTTAANGQVLLQADIGIDQLGGLIDSTELLIGGDLADEGTGNVNLTGSNTVARLAANLQNGLTLVNAVSLDIADLTYASICGTTEAICGLNVNQNLSLTVTGALTQTAAVIVGGTTDLVATAEICFTGGDCTGDGLNDNDFVGLVNASGSTVELVDQNDLNVGVISAVDDIYLRSGLNGTGAITLNGDVTATQVLLQSDSGVTQLAGVITATDLLLGGDLADESSGDFVLNQLNLVDNLAADLQNSLTFRNGISLVVNDLTYSSVCLTTEAICGLDVTQNLDLNIAGDLTQLAAVMVGGTSNFVVDGDLCLTGGDCSGDGLNDNDFVGLVTADADTVEIVDRNDLLVGAIVAIDDIYLRSGDNGVGAITLTDNLTATQVLLQSDSGVTQTGGAITATELLLGGNLIDEGSGDFVLDQVNQVDQLAAELQNDLTLINGVSLVIGDLTYTSDCGTTEAICGLRVGQTLDLQVTGDLTQTAAVIAQASVQLQATGDICLTGGDCTGDGLNDNDFGVIVSATGETVELVDSNSMTVVSVTATNDVFLRAGDNGAGSLTLLGTVATTALDGQVLLQADSGVSAFGAATISTSDLLLGGDLVDEGSGNFVLLGNNQINNLAANLQNNLSLTTITSVTIADLNYVSDCGTTEAICGLNIGQDLSLDIGGVLAQTAAVIVNGTTLIVADDAICLTGGDCSGDGLNDNDFVGLVTATGTTVELVDANALDVGVITAVDDVRLVSGDNGSGALTLNGNVSTSAVDGQVLLQSDSGITQVGGVVTTSELLVGGDNPDQNAGDVLLTANNQAARLSAQLQDSLSYTSAVSVIVAHSTYASVCDSLQVICGLNIGGNLTMNVAGNLSQDGDAPVIVAGTTDLVVNGEICWVGGDCDFDPTNPMSVLVNENDWGGLVTASGVSVQLADINDLTTGTITGTQSIFLRSGDGMATSGAINLTGNLLTLAADGQIVLQSDSGVVQSGGNITTHQLLLGGDVADEGSGYFQLDLTNAVNQLAADLDGGTLQFINQGNLELLATASFSRCDGDVENYIGVFVGGAGDVLSANIDNPEIALAETIQGQLGNVDQQFNPNADFTHYLNLDDNGTTPTFADLLASDTTALLDDVVNDIGLAIINQGSLTTQAGAAVEATQGDIYLETTASGALTVADRVTVADANNRILSVAGGDLALVGSGRFERGIGGSVGLVFTEFNDLILLDPGIASNANAQVDAVFRTQNLEFLVGTPIEQLFHTSVFWGIAGPEDNTFDLDSLTPTQTQALTTFLFNMPLDTNFESRSFYGAGFDGIADGLGTEVTSQPQGDTFDNSGKTPDGIVPSASFRDIFLQFNPEFRNVQVMFNDPGINIFENASAGGGSNLVDLNVATADFQGLAQIGTPPVFEPDETVVQTPERIEISRPEEPVVFTTVVVEEQPLLVQNVFENFVVVVYFESQFEADQFEASFEDLASKNETGEIDYEQVQELLEANGLDKLEWNSTEEGEALDVNRIREILERAGLDLGDEDDEDWVEKYKQWLKDAKAQGEAPDVPRGVFKIIQVDNGKAAIQGDDVDRRFVPEPSDDQGGQEYQFDPQNDSDDDQSSLDPHDGQGLMPESQRLSRWKAMLAESERSEQAGTTSATIQMTTAAASTALAMMVRQQAKSNADLQSEMEQLQQEKSANRSRNIFSRAARFLRRSQSRCRAEQALEEPGS